MNNGHFSDKLVSAIAADEYAKESHGLGDASTGLWKPLPHLDSIRLFKLSRDTSTGLLRFSLSEHRLSGLPKYTALSYTWGSPGNVSIIENEHGHRTLRRNLFAFLNTLQNCISYGEIPENTLFWVDALCIDQESLGEKAQQVHQIGKTFQRAEKVLVWLGTHQDGRGGCLNAVVSPSTPAVMERFTSHVYWTRVWIVQEFIISTHVILMDESHTVHIGRIRFRDFDGSLPTALARSRGKFKESRAGSVASIPWEELLRNFKHHGCTDPRDRIYALRSIASWGKGIKVDYFVSAASLFWKSLDPSNFAEAADLVEALELDWNHPELSNIEEEHWAMSEETDLNYDDIIASEGKRWPKMDLGGLKTVDPDLISLFSKSYPSSPPQDSKFFMVTGTIHVDDVVVFSKLNQVHLVLRNSKLDPFYNSWSTSRSCQICGVFVENKPFWRLCRFDTSFLEALPTQVILYTSERDIRLEAMKKRMYISLLKIYIALSNSQQISAT